MDAIEFLKMMSSVNGCVALTRTERDHLIELINKQETVLKNRESFIDWVQKNYPDVVLQYLE